MNWHKTKTILIVYFIIINIALMTYLLYSNSRQEMSRMQVAEQVVQLLDNNNITIDRKLFKDNNYTNEIKNVYVLNVINNYEDFAHTVLGDTVFPEEENTYRTNNAYIRFEGDKFEIRSDTVPLYSVNTDKSTALKHSEDYLKSIGIDIKNAKNIIQTTEYGYNITFSEYIDDFRIFGTQLTVELKHDGIYAVYGNWYNRKDDNYNKSNVKDIPGVLIEHMNMHKGENMPNHVIDAELGYSAFDSTDYHESVLLTPVWKITYNRDSTEYIDAREIEAN